MIYVNTNVYNRFTNDELEHIKEKSKGLGTLDFGIYEDKLPDLSVPKFVVRNIDLSDFGLFEHLNILIQELYSFSKINLPVITEVQMWIIGKLRSNSLNIAFSLYDWTNAVDTINSLKVVLLNFNNNSKKVENKTLLVSYSTDTKGWSIKVL